MSVLVRIKKSKINECDAGGVSAPMTTLNNVEGMGNPVPPSENSLGSGDSWGNMPFGMATQKKHRYKLKKNNKNKK